LQILENHKGLEEAHARFRSGEEVGVVDVVAGILGIKP